MNNNQGLQPQTTQKQSDTQSIHVSVFNPTLTELENLKEFKNEKKKEDAKKIIDAMKIKKLNSKHELVSYRLCEPIDELQNFGEGLFFYFYFLKFFGIVFAIICLIIVAPIVINSMGNGLKFVSQTDIFVATTLGNLQRVTYSPEEKNLMADMTEAERVSYTNDKNKQLANIFIVYMILDMIICLFLLISYYVFQRKVDTYSALINKKNVSVSRYTLMIFGVPETGITERELAEYFRQFGNVVKVSFAYRYEDALNNILNIAHFKSKLKGLKSKPKNQKNLQLAKRIVKGMKDEIKTVNRKINVKKLDINNLSSFKVYCAFVTFDNASSPNEIRKQFKAAYKKTFWQRFCCSKTRIAEQYIFRGEHKLKFKTPDHPRNIYWENLEYTNTSRNLKVVLLIVMSILILLLSLIINMLLTAISSSETIECGQEHVTVDSIDAEQDAGAKSKLLYCYCSSLSISEILKIETNYSHCNSYYIKQLKALGISFAVGIALTLINKLVDITNQKLSDFIHYSSKTEVVKKRILFSYIIQYLNTAFVVYLIYSSIFNFSIAELFNKIFKKDVIKVEFYLTDVNRQWYPVIGSKIITPLLISIFLPHVSDFIITLIYAGLRNRRGRLAKTTSKCIKAQNPPEFLFDVKYANILKNIFVVLTFSTGIPLLYACLLLIIVMMYWLHKYTVLRFSKVPPLYSSDVVISVTNMIPFAIIIHMIFGIYFLSNDDVFPTSLNLSMGLGELTNNITNVKFFQEVINKSVRCLPYTVLLLLIIIAFVFENSIFWFFKRVICNKKIYNANDKLDTYSNNYERIKYFSLPNYNMALNPQYRRLLKLTLVNYKSIKSFADGSSLQNIINSTNMLGNKLDQRSMDKLDAILDNELRVDGIDEYGDDMGSSNIESIKLMDEEEEVLEAEQPNPLLFNLKRNGRTYSLDIVDSKKHLPHTQHQNNGSKPNIDSYNHIYRKANTDSKHTVDYMVKVDNDGERLDIRDIEDSSDISNIKDKSRGTEEDI